MSETSISDDVVRRFLAEKMDVIKREYAPSRLVIFGSRARGEGTPDSDIDLIVVSERFRDTRFVNRMGRFLITVRPDVHVDAFCYTPEEFEVMMGQQSPFVREAVESGLHLI